jgi:hypothetical protein
MQRLTAGSVLVVLGLPLMLFSLFAGAGSSNAEYSFGLEQKAGVILGCAALWLACIVASGWRPRTPVYVQTADALRDALHRASDATWFDLSQSRTVRRLGVLQFGVMLATTIGLLAFTSAEWYVALLAGLALSIGLNLAISRSSASTLRRERNRRSR